MVVVIHPYLVGLGGLVVGAAAGLVLAVVLRNGKLASWDARVTAPLLLGAAAAHAVLIPAVELERQVLFTTYAIALVVTVCAGLAGVAIWRVAAIVLPSGSILGYAYFAILASQADYAGLIIKAVELGAIACALLPVLGARRRKPGAPSVADD